MDELYQDVQEKGLVFAYPHYFSLVELIRATKFIPYKDQIWWLDWIKLNNN